MSSTTIVRPAIVIGLIACAAFLSAFFVVREANAQIPTTLICDVGNYWNGTSCTKCALPGEIVVGPTPLCSAVGGNMGPQVSCYSAGTFCAEWGKTVEWRCGCDASPGQGWNDQGGGCYHHDTGNACVQSESCTGKTYWNGLQCAPCALPGETVVGPTPLCSAVGGAGGGTQTTNTTNAQTCPAGAVQTWTEAKVYSSSNLSTEVGKQPISAVGVITAKYQQNDNTGIGAPRYKIDFASGVDGWVQSYVVGIATDCSALTQTGTGGTSAVSPTASAQTYCTPTGGGNGYKTYDSASQSWSSCTRCALPGEIVVGPTPNCPAAVVPSAHVANTTTGTTPTTNSCGSAKDISVTGRNTGVVWGSGPYGATSDMNAAAVHAGLVTIGQTANIRVTPVGMLSTFNASQKNGVSTFFYTQSMCAVNLSLVGAGGTSSSGANQITQNLQQGSGGSEVVALQTLLVSFGYLSRENISGYYGPLTEAAVQKYQCAKGIVCSGTPATTGYGAVGPATRTALNSTTGGTTSTNPPTGSSSPMPTAASLPQFPSIPNPLPTETSALTNIIVDLQNYISTLTKYLSASKSPTPTPTPPPAPGSTTTGSPTTPIASCYYAPAPNGCTYVQGPNFNPQTNCGLVLNCPNAATTQPGGGCVVTGCSSHLCVDAGNAGMVTTCEWKSEYACYATAKCERQANGQCGWTQTEQLKQCIASGGLPTL